MHYSCQRIPDGEGMAHLRRAFPHAKADALNVVLFSTSGIHGTYATIEDIERGEETAVTFLILRHRMVWAKYGNAAPEGPDDIEFLKQLRQSSWGVLATIGRDEQ